MASRSVSPGGALLRASRIFSIPPPLPRPAGELSSTAIFSSETATLPHPTHLSITTPQTSLARGDWGFKRPLPLRSTTKTSTPFIRVEAIDTLEHITEFGSSADHTLTLRKWQELGVPLTAPVPKKQETNIQDPNVVGRSVFEDEIDSTTQVESGGVRKDDVRWKFKGPWLAGQNEGEFNEYVQKEVRKRKTDFHKFIRESCATSLTKEARRAASGEEEAPLAIKAGDITDAQLTEYIKSLRQDRTELYKQIRHFLDLPPSPSHKGDAKAAMLDFLSGTGKDANATLKSSADNSLPVSLSPYAERGPPKTHPSAGLSYSRTSAYLHNHPEFGPQKHKPPVQARVVMPKGAATGNFAPALGVGGFVTDLPAGDNSFDLRGSTQRAKSSRGTPRPIIPGLLNIEPDKVGGSKAYVHPKSATIDPKGRVVMVVVPGDEDAVAVKEGTTDSIPKVDMSKPSYNKQVGFQAPTRGIRDAARGEGSYGLVSGSSRRQGGRMLR